jgi:hypothetical protein
MSTSTINLIDNLTDKILNLIKDLPLEKQKEILEFTEFISNQYHQEKLAENKAKKKRIAGLYKDKGWISDDFNDPLPPEILGKIL